jgi:hypothetical protein
MNQSKRLIAACLMIIYLITFVGPQTCGPTSPCLCTDGGCHTRDTYCCSNTYVSPAVTCSGCPYTGAPDYCCAPPALQVAAVIFVF